MARLAGTTTEETRGRLLDAAASVFARLGYEKASIGDLAAEAGLSSGSIYAHFGSKAELFAATLRAHSDQEITRLVGGDAPIDVADFLRRRGAALDLHTEAQGSLLVEAIVAAKHDPKVGELLASAFAGREGKLGELIRGAQAMGVIDPTISPEATARLIVMLALGSLLVAAMGLPATDHAGWESLIASLVGRFQLDGAS